MRERDARATKRARKPTNKETVKAVFIHSQHISASTTYAHPSTFRPSRRYMRLQVVRCPSCVDAILLERCREVFHRENGALPALREKVVSIVTRTCCAMLEQSLYTAAVQARAPLRKPKRRKNSPSPSAVPPLLRSHPSHPSRPAQPPNSCR